MESHELEFKSLPKDTVKKLSQALAHNENFFLKKNDYEKLRHFLQDVLEKHRINESELGHYDKSLIISEAKSFFERKLLMKKENELIGEIRELKEKGESKIAIRSKLDLTQGMLNKYYYK